MRIFNLINRLYDHGVEIFWNTDKKIYDLNSYFIIIDKTYLVKKIFFNDGDQLHDEFASFANIFNKICLLSEKIFLKPQPIKINLKADRTIIKRNSANKIYWEVNNANYIDISPKIGEVSSKGNEILRLKKDTLFKLTASNKEHSQIKYLFVRVINNDDFHVDVEVFDPLIKENIFLNPNLNSSIETYVCYHGQEIILSWNPEKKFKIFEKKSGKIPNTGRYITNIFNQLEFKFEYTIEKSIFIKEFKIKPVPIDENEPDNSSLITMKTKH